MESKSKKKQVKKAPVKRAVKAKHKAPPPNLCVNCAPLGYTQVLAMLLVSVFSLVAVLSMATVKMDKQAVQIQNQANQINVLK